MTAPTKINGLRNMWVGYAAFAAVLTLLHHGFHADALRNAIIGFAIMAGLAWFCASKLQSKSSLVWAFWVVSAVLGVGIAGLELLDMLSDGGEFGVLRLVRIAASIAVHVQTFRTLRHAEVKRFVMT